MKGRGRMSGPAVEGSGGVASTSVESCCGMAPAARMAPASARMGSAASMTASPAVATPAAAAGEGQGSKEPDNHDRGKPRSSEKQSC